MEITASAPAKERRENATIRLQPSIKKKAQILALEEDKNLSDLIEEALEALLEKARRQSH